jgi:hypothetical protein
MRNRLIGALALSLMVFFGATAVASAQCTGASPSNTNCGPTTRGVDVPGSPPAPPVVSPAPSAQVLSATASRPAAAVMPAAASPAVAAATTNAAPSALAFTGSDAAQLALVGGAAIVLGLVLRSRGRTQPQHS